jgi:hypothetical protein
MLYFNYLFYFFRSFILLFVLSFYFSKKKIKRMPLPSGLKIKLAKVILFLKLQHIALAVFFSNFLASYSPPLEGCPQGGVDFYWYIFKC